MCVHRKESTLVAQLPPSVKVPYTKIMVHQSGNVVIKNVCFYA